VLEADPPKRLVQTWHPLFDPRAAVEPPTRLTWEIHEERTGAAPRYCALGPKQAELLAALP
jgi:hypothetical protein